MVTVIQTSMQFAVVTARKGSTRLPRKNVLDLDGRPLFRWTLDAALEAKVFDRVWVSTDDEAILDHCRSMDGVLLDQRPAELCTSTVPALKALAHVIAKAREELPGLERFCMLHPTSPFLGAVNVARAMTLLDTPGAEFVIGVRRFGIPPHFAVDITNGVIPVREGSLTRVTRTQDVPVMHHPAGGVYAGRIDAFLRQGHFWGPSARPLELGALAAWDINEAEDLEVARIIAKGVAR